ncbi:phosphoribosyltransferase [Pseudonocardia xinjiangensis]|uniref:Phosphoribosyltransferase n=1 Tax=Pseudonocardia xinjiangensis TaxID=75289 RepID=A0ABX1RNI1_9PSEU|nr:phosphoribosyltransferase family protein [Pseudonocardia xinjiangensis]NMH81962.1 phosphoribosyltransferase [Pseudonocardia xinjiangensis]
MAVGRRRRVFADRAEAGERLGAQLGGRTWTDLVVLGLARGGVPVAAMVAATLGAPLDVAVARKIGAPGRPEWGVGAVTAEGPVGWDVAALRRARSSTAELAGEAAHQQAEAGRQLRRYREVAAAVPVAGRDVVLVDDGLATGVTARAALARLRGAGPRLVVLAVPVGRAGTAAALRADGAADEVVLVTAPSVLGAVSCWYRDFDQTSDAEVLAALAASR